MIDLADFTAQSKSMLIAPAGYGKTHTISSSLKILSGSGKQLVLTHTHAGVAAIKEKVTKEGIPESNFSIETISSFCQRYVFAFHNESNIPSQDKGGLYYSFILDKATTLLRRECVSSIVSRSYKGVFVDEYQDCSLSQHNFINVLAGILPTRILGDPLQGIFGFNGETPVDLDDPVQMAGYTNNKFELVEPQRWMRDNNPQLGEDLKNIRLHLLSKQPINLSLFSSIENYTWPSTEVQDGYSDYSKKIRELLKLKDVLFIHPISDTVYPRLNFAKKFGGRLNMLEAIDAKELYQLAGIADRIKTEEPILLVREMALLLFNKTEIKVWFNDKGLKRKNKKEDQKVLLPLRECSEKLSIGSSLGSLAELLKLVSQLPKVRKYRRDLFNSIYWAMKEAEVGNTSTHKAMEDRRNKLRRVGRKVYGRCLGTTLLTKGLEFDNVVVLNAHEFKCPKHLYVALTRASKRLIVISETNTIQPR